MKLSFNEYIKLKSLIEESSNTIVMSFSRMNPPTLGHMKLLNKLVEVAKIEHGKAILFLSHSQDKKKNPLSYNEKIEIVKSEAPKGLTIVNTEARNIFDAMKVAVRMGAKNIIMVAGSDRVPEYERYEKYKNDIGINNYSVVSAGSRDPDTEGITGISATKLRMLAVEGKFEEFSKGFISKDKKTVTKAYNAIRKAFDI